MSFDLEVNVKYPNSECLFSAIHLVSIYQNNNILYVVSKLKSKDEHEIVTTPLVSQTVKVKLEDIKGKLKIEDLLIFPKGLHEETMSQTAMRRLLEEAKLVYGKDYLSAEMTLVPLRQFQTFNLKWLKRIVMGNFWWSTSTAFNGFFAIQNSFKEWGKSATSLFKRPSA